MFSQLLLYYFALFFLFVCPGYLLWRLLLVSEKRKFSFWETIPVVFGLGVAVIDFLMLGMDYFHLGITRKNLLLAVLVLCFLLWAGKKWRQTFIEKKEKNDEKEKNDYIAPSYRQILLFILVFSLALLIRGKYLADGIFPKTTDLGHHIYWANYISIKGSLPHYSEKFIIGEHLSLAAINIMTHIPYLSPLPILWLSLFNVLSLLLLFALSYYLAGLFNKLLKKLFQSLPRITVWDSALAIFFLSSVFYAITPPQIKFVSGGVVGNVMGNFFFLLALYSLLLLLKEKRVIFVNLFIISLLVLLYTHHLSTFALLYVLLALLLGWLTLLFVFQGLKFKRIWQIIKKPLFLFWQPTSLFLILLGIVFLTIVRTPSYLNPGAVKTAVGEPVKLTRVGFSLMTIVDRLGAWRVTFALIFVFISFLALILYWRRFRQEQKRPKEELIWPLAGLSLLWLWAGIIFLMSWKPAWLMVDIPSRRIITYLTFPVSLLAGFGFVYFLGWLYSKLNKQVITWWLVFFLGVLSVVGLAREINVNQHREVENSAVMQTYLSAVYLAERTSAKDIILKDHRFLPGDTWMKLFFMRGYRYPLSRTYDRRYDDPYSQRETCTREMMSRPFSAEAEKCFAKTGTKYLVVRKGYEDVNFAKKPEFQPVYVGENVVVWERFDLPKVANDSDYKSR